MLLSLSLNNDFQGHQSMFNLKKVLNRGLKQFSLQISQCKNLVSLKRRLRLRLWKQMIQTKIQFQQAHWNISQVEQALWCMCRQKLESPKMMLV